MSDAPIIAVEDLHFAYPDGTLAIDGITVSLHRGEHVAVVGANGAGKSTFLLHLNGLLQGKGRIQIDGVPLDASSLAIIRRRVGFVFQDPDDQLFCPTVADDVAFGPRQQRLPAATVQCRVESALTAVGISDLAKRHPHHLSLGQKKRAAIATVLASQPDILVLDEPTSSLDPRSRREFLALLRGLDCTLVLATHDLPAVRDLCQRVLVLKDGRILADGPPSIVLGDQNILDDAHLA